MPDFRALTRIPGMLENTSVMGQGIVLAQSVFVLECRSMNLGMNLGMNTVVVSSYEISCYCIPTIMWLSGYIPLLCQLKVILLIGNIVSRPLNPKPYLVLQLLSNSPFTLAWNHYEPVDGIVHERGSASIYTSHHNIYIYIYGLMYVPDTYTHLAMQSR